MRVTCEGWRRIQKYHKFMNCDVSGLKPTSKKIRNRDEVHIELKEDGVTIFSGIEGLKIKGNFSVEVSLSKKEIINLAKIALANEPFGALFAP